MILDISENEIANLGDADLRKLIGYLCEREVFAAGYSPAAVTWGGNQNAADGGIDVRVALLPNQPISGYVPKSSAGFQVKAQDMPHGAILEEMAPGGFIRPSITRLAAEGGAYVIVSSRGSVSDTALQDRREAMSDAVKALPGASALTLEFYDRRRIASWVNQHTGVVSWVREILGLAISGWRPFEDWSSSPAPLDTPYLLDDETRLVGPSIAKIDGLNAEEAIAKLRTIVQAQKGVVRLVGLSGVGKTRIIQALFDPRIGSNALLHSDALYTDVSDHPDPAPQEMLSRLISQRERVVLIVDNCSVELHRKLATQISKANCELSLITVEYDINDDEPANTEVFKLEPASSDLIDKLLQLRYPTIAPPSRHVIVAFSEGNARVAFALAETAKNGESVAGLKDSELFQRLFDQQKGKSQELLEAATACALVYSFDGETLEGKDSELEALAAVVGQSVDQLYKNIAELRRRQLLQNRGPWRAILPHALANRLAKRALENIAPQRIEDVIIRGERQRLRLSFSRRIGYLHGNECAIQIARKWLAPGGPLTPLGQLDEYREELLENIAPVDPAATLSYVEVAAADSGEFFTKKNRNRGQIAGLLRSLAYDPSLFERCVALLKRFALSEPSESEESLDIFKSLFWVQLSGTHATLAQRSGTVSSLLRSASESEQNLGLILLDAMLETAYFNPRRSFEFGAWSRDLGFYPKTPDETKEWFARALNIAGEVITAGKDYADRVRHTVAEHISGLLDVGMIDEVTSLANSLQQMTGWPEAWVSVRGTQRRLQSHAEPAMLEKLTALAEYVRPKNLVQQVRAYALFADGSDLDFAESEVDDGQEDARERLFDLCLDLGKQLAGSPESLNLLLTELLIEGSHKVHMLGQGIAMACESEIQCWGTLRDRFLQTGEQERKPQLLGGFLAGVMVNSPNVAESVLDEALQNPQLQPYLVYWQTTAGIKGAAFERMLKALALDAVPVPSFGYFKFGRVHEGFNEEQFSILCRKLIERTGGMAVAGELLGMRIFGRQADKVPISESLRALSRTFLAELDLEHCDRLDLAIGSAIRIGLSRPEHEDQARALCLRLLGAVSGWKRHPWEYPETIAALTKTFPIAILDTLLEHAAGEKCAGVVHDLVRYGRNPFKEIAEETWLQWAATKPERRYELLARVIPFSRLGEDDPATGWSPSALRLIEKAPNPVPVLNTFLRRFYPGSWHGSLAQILSTRLPLIDELRQHPNPTIAGWAIEAAAKFTAEVERERADERAESDARNSTFE